MTIYILLILSAIGTGMAISVYTFGTGGKRKRIFQDIYFSVEDNKGVGVVYTKNGEYAAILRMENPVDKYSADIDGYYEYTRLFTAIVQTLGEGYALHKQDIFVRKPFREENGGKREYLSESYFRYFDGREYTDSLTYLTVTQEAQKSRLFSFDNKRWRDFLVKIRKVQDQLKDTGVRAEFLTKEAACEYIDRYFAMDFTHKTLSMNNFKVDEECVRMGDQKCKIFSLVDVDSINLPGLVRPFANIEVNNTRMPVDLMAAIDQIPEARTVIYNQMIFIPNQKRELALLEKKKNRHASIPNPGNQMAVEDIKQVQEVMAREGKQLVYTHYNLVVCCNNDTDLQKPTNHLENTFGRMGIHISKRAYNQLELFVNSFPGNCYGMSAEYDRFLTLGDAATCLMYKEKIQHSEETPLKIYYTDRQGVPVAIDITGKEGKNKLTDNSNFFCLGPSGSGKSFHMNSVVRQLHEQGTDVVMVDTGNSYEGLCEYLGGKYISYTEEKPITMNPFNITQAELNIEKIDFLKNLILLIWKGSDGKISELDKVPIGYPTPPEINYGFGLSVGYKGLDASFFFQGSGRQSFWLDLKKITPFLDGDAGENGEDGLLGQNAVLDVIANSYWSENNRNPYAFWPRLANQSVENNNQTSTWFMQDATFLRLKSVEIGYTVPKNLVKKFKVQNLRFYVSGTNLLCWSKFKLWDPEMAGNGLGYPVQRVINVGLNLGF